jgi:hypothetical protein
VKERSKGGKHGRCSIKASSTYTCEHGNYNVVKNCGLWKIIAMLWHFS